MRRLSRTVTAVAALVWLAWSPAVASTGSTVRTVAVAPYPSAAAAISDAEAAAILQKASRLLQNNDGKAANGDGDVACDLTLRQLGTATPFADVVLDGIVNNGQDFANVCHQPGLVHVVNQINWCDGPRANLLGCSDLSPCIVVVRAAGTFTATQEPILWAHEYGHTRGLKHSCEGSACTARESDRVMHPVIADNHKKIGAVECHAYTH